jgi:hypothetical protein
MRPLLPVSLLIAIATAFASPAGAQTTHNFSPKHLRGTEGRYFTARFGSHKAMRYQMVDGENRGTATFLKDIAFRLDHRTHSSRTTASGRTWSKLVVDLADGDVSTMTTAFSTNLKSTPTRVFDGPVSWPDFNGTPTTSPALWGGFSGAYVVPFKTRWGYLGTRDVLSDWQFTGGKLKNTRSWTGAKGYWLDSYEDPDEPLPGSYRRVPASRLHNNSTGVTSRCNDSYFGSNSTGAYTDIFARVYGPSASNPNWRDQLLMWSTSYYTAPGSSVIHAWAFATNDFGFNLSTGCNRLHLLGLTLYFTLPVKPATTNPLASATIPRFRTKWVRGLSTLRVVVQAGWTDSVNGRLRLTQAHEVILPGAKPPAAPLRSAIYQVPGAAVVGPDKTYFANPALRYRR